MVTFPIAADQLDASNTLSVLEVENASKAVSLEDFLLNPLDRMEWVDGQLVEKTGMTLRHGLVQSRLDCGWRVYKQSSDQGGEVFTEAPCRTLKQVRRPDIAYVAPAFLGQLGNAAVAPHSFPLIAEIVSPTDYTEEVFAKAQEYLQSGCEEVWLVLPESFYVFVITSQQRLWFAAGDVVSTQAVLPGFSVAVDELLA
jgi:Uma2 family endonuclease